LKAGRFSVKICGVHGVSLIDYPGRIASVVFLGGCNFRCPFCQNVSLVEGYRALSSVPEDSVLDLLRCRRGFIDGVVITGGEPLMYGEELTRFLTRLRETRLSIKVDTNGYDADTVQELVVSGLVDYVAMDVKTSLEKYHVAAGRRVAVDTIQKSIGIIMGSSVEYEFRTTCVPGLVEKADIEGIARLIEGARRYYLQQYRADRPTLDPAYMNLFPYSGEELEEFRLVARPYVESVGVRGM
jgi:pyruvate formate lyase activating enzyme